MCEAQPLTKTRKTMEKTIATIAIDLRVPGAKTFLWMKKIHGAWLKS